ncbi:MAG TPA: SRPBCC domain-containing protein [Pyrinomonadaceae bacterium]|nr:SRPBCC domain-containing protein [Pyrinomonadaceae bacterium]
MDIKFEVQTRIQKPVEEVFDAVQNPDKLSGYFTNGGASAPLVEGTTVEWAFADTPGQTPFKFPVIVKKVVPNKQIILEWEGSKDGNTKVEINFEPSGSDSTLVRIAESGWRESQDDLNRSYGNCMGWSQMLSALKAYAEYGINLRKGAYEGLYSADDKQSASK